MTNFRTSLLLAAVAVAVAPHSLRAQGAPACPMGNLIMNGAYVTSGSGTVTGVGAITTVGLVVYNGDGTGQVVSSTASVNGASSTSSKVPITFTVNPDCTGSKVLGKTHMNFVISPDGETIYWIITESGVTLSGTGVRLRR